MPPAAGTCRVISDRCTKIDAPMMMPATIAVAPKQIDRAFQKEKNRITRRLSCHPAPRASQSILAT
jgi:hypothetical protein